MGFDVSTTATQRRKQYQERCIAHYQPFWQMAVPIDLIACSTSNLMPYKLIIAPMLYMLRQDIAARLDTFVRRGERLS